MSQAQGSQIEEAQPLGASFRDPSGFLFTSDGVLYRQVNQAYRINYDQLMDSGLYQQLVEEQLLIPHEELSASSSLPGSGLYPEIAYKVLRPEKVSFISYPYEWCFSQLKDAALVTLKIQKKALEHGMSLKDSSAYNIQFYRGKPVLVDTLSFEAHQPGSPWVAYRQFCQHFLAPLSLMSYVDIRLGQLLRVYIDGIPLDLASELLPARTKLVIPLQMHIHLHAASQKRYSARAVDTNQRVNQYALMGLIDSLESGIRRLSWSHKDTEWESYYEETNYTPAGLQHKEQLVKEFLETARPSSVWDLGANTGRFSRLASDQGILTQAFDVDPGAVELNYQESISRGEKNLLPLLVDLTNPSPATGWSHTERSSLMERGPVDMVFALALIHHMAISNNVPLDRLASFFHSAGRWLVVEFIPKSDSQVQRLLSSRVDIFPDYNPEAFEKVFRQYFQIHRAEAIIDSDRRLYLMERR